MNALRMLCLTLCCLCGSLAPWAARPVVAQDDDPGLWRSIADGLDQGITLKRLELGHIR